MAGSYSFHGLLATIFLIIIVVKILNRNNLKEVFSGENSEKKYKQIMNKQDQIKNENKRNNINQKRQDNDYNMNELNNNIDLDVIEFLFKGFEEDLDSLYRILDVYKEDYQGKIDLSNFKEDGEFNYRLIERFDLPFCDDEALEIEKICKKEPKESLKIIRDYLQDEILNLEIFIENEKNKLLKLKTKGSKPIIVKKSDQTSEETEKKSPDHNEKDTFDTNSSDYIELEPGEGFYIDLDDYGNPIRKRGNLKGWGGQPERNFDTPWKP